MCDFVWLASKEGERFLIFGHGETSNNRPGGSFTLPLSVHCFVRIVSATGIKNGPLMKHKCQCNLSCLPKHPSSSRGTITTNVCTYLHMYHDNQNSRRKARFKRADSTCSPVIDNGPRKYFMEENKTRIPVANCASIRKRFWKSDPDKGCRPFPFAPSQPSPPFVPILSILITAPPSDGRCKYLSPYDLCYPFSPLKKGGGVGWDRRY